MSGPSDDQILERLDHLIVILSVVFKEKIDEVRAEVRADPIARAILDGTQDEWIAAGDLQQRVSESAKVSSRTVRARVGELVDQGLLNVRGAGNSVSYRSAGVV